MQNYNVYKYTNNPVAKTKKQFLRGFMDVKEAIEYHKAYEQSEFIWHTIEVEY